MELTLIDSPFANLRNIRRACTAVGASVTVTADPAVVAAAEKIVLPGVGSFAAAMSWLCERELHSALRSAFRQGAAILGICVGHQLLFEWSEELGGSEGLALLQGGVRRFAQGDYPVPQIGWNRLRLKEGSALLSGLSTGVEMYFVNSFRVAESEAAVAWADYGGEFVAAVEMGTIYGVQFHPEKSSTAGLALLRNFVQIAPGSRNAVAQPTWSESCLSR